MKTKLICIFALMFCLSSCLNLGKSRKEKVVDKLLENPNVAEIVKIQGHDDWETKDFFVKMILTDGTRIMLMDVDFDLWGRKTEDLHFVFMELLGDLSLVQFKFDYKKWNALGVSQFQNPPDDCAPCIGKLYTEKSVDYLINNHREIIEELKKYPLVPEKFVDEFIVNKNYDITNLRNYNFVNFNVDKGSYPVIISSEKYHSW